MKTSFLKATTALFIVTAAGIARSANQPAPTNAPASTNGIGARIQFDSQSYDWGRVLMGTQVRHDFVFTNTGDATLKITGVIPGCHCTTVGDWTREVEPGKTGIIPIKFDSSNLNGPAIRSPMVTCNDKRQPSLRLQIHGTIFRTLDVNPTWVAFTIQPDSSEDVSGVVHIVNNGDSPMTLLPPTSNQRTFTAELKTNEPGRNFDLIIKTVPPLEPGNTLDPSLNQASITVQSTASNSQPISIYALATVMPIVSAAPRQIMLPAGPLKTNETFTVQLQNKGKQPLALSEPSVDALGADATLDTVQPGKNFTASVNFAAGFQAPPGKTMVLTIKTDSSRFPVLKIPIKQALPPPQAPQNVRMIQ